MAKVKEAEEVVEIIDTESGKVLEDDAKEIDFNPDESYLLMDDGDEDRLKERFGDLISFEEDKPAEVAAAPVADEAEVPAPVETPADPDAEMEELKKLADFGRQWQQAFATDPDGALLQLLKSDAFTDEKRAALVQQVQDEANSKAANSKVEEYEPLTPIEEAVKERWSWLTDGERIVSEALEFRDRELQATYAAAEAVNAKVDALASILEVALPDFDLQAILTDFNTKPEGSVKDAVGRIYRTKLKDLGKVEKQKRVERPDTPTSVVTTSLEDELGAVTSFADAYALADKMLSAQGR